MVLPEAALAGVGGGKAPGVEPAPSGERDPVCAEDGLPMAAIAWGVPGLGCGLLLLLPLVARWDVGASAPHAALATAAEGRSAQTPDGGLPG